MELAIERGWLLSHERELRGIWSFSRLRRGRLFCEAHVDEPAIGHQIGEDTADACIDCAGTGRIGRRIFAGSGERMV